MDAGRTGNKRDHGVMPLVDNGGLSGVWHTRCEGCNGAAVLAPLAPLAPPSDAPPNLTRRRPARLAPDSRVRLPAADANVLRSASHPVTLQHLFLPLDHHPSPITSTSCSFNSQITPNLLPAEQQHTLPTQPTSNEQHGQPCPRSSAWCPQRSPGSRRRAP